ncbi:MAG: tetratricopeptide repeat protein, partial [Selenomonadaceae bacterium]|nr:tetratricopeptide repeat protein [Selenomonadaceae bacterium]
VNFNLLARGIAYENLGEYDKALADYNKALELVPKDERSQNNRQRVLTKMKK